MTTWYNNKQDFELEKVNFSTPPVRSSLLGNLQFTNLSSELSIWSWISQKNYNSFSIHVLSTQPTNAQCRQLRHKWT